MRELTREEVVLRVIERSQEIEIHAGLLEEELKRLAEILERLMEEADE